MTANPKTQTNHTISRRHKPNGTSIHLFYENFPDDESVITYLFDLQKDQISICDQCGLNVTLYKIKGTKRYSGLCCNYIYRTVTKGTILFKSTFPLQSWFLAMLYFSNSRTGVPVAFLRAMFGIGKDTAFKVADQIRKHMALRENLRTVGGDGVPVGVSFRTIRRTRDRGKPRGRQTLVMAIFDRSQVVTTVVPNRKIQTITPIILARVQRESILLYVDDVERRRLLGHGFHKRLSRTFQMESANLYPEPLNLVISYWTNFQRVFRATHGHARGDNLWKYLGEFNFRYNRRDCTQEIFWDMISTLISTES